ncbi:DUF4870 domain-containing protein [Georgenia wangjunii]|uniref:DUF4870 domain-containing protein n=1 Tax=Georgenia wangjunii TaxID=3117730 RepID=UPI002F269992
MSTLPPPPPPSGHEPPPGGYGSTPGGYPSAGDHGTGGPAGPGGYDQAGGYQPPGGYQQSGGYGQTGGSRPPSGYRPPAGADDRAIAVLAHLSPLIAMVLSAGWLSFVGPLLVWVLMRQRGELVRNAAASAFNFNITVWLATIAGWICLFTIILIPLAIVLWIGAFVLQVVFSVIGAVRANRGEVYRYPMQIAILT